MLRLIQGGVHLDHAVVHVFHARHHMDAWVVRCRNDNVALESVLRTFQDADTIYLSTAIRETQPHSRLCFWQR